MRCLSYLYCRHPCCSFGGWLAAWGGLIDYVNTNGNLFFFQVFGHDAAFVKNGIAVDPENASAMVGAGGALKP